MKTTIDLADELMVEVKVAAARRRCTLREFFAAALRHELSGTPVPKRRRKPMKLTTDQGGLAPGFDVSSRSAMYDWFDRHDRG